MKDTKLLIWLTQLGLSVAVPLVGGVLLGVWLQEVLGWGIRAVFAGIALGVSGAVSGLRGSLRAMDRMAAHKPVSDPLPVTGMTDGRNG